jgi:hypothetical protein
VDGVRAHLGSLLDQGEYDQRRPEGAPSAARLSCRYGDRETGHPRPRLADYNTLRRHFGASPAALAAAAITDADLGRALSARAADGRVRDIAGSVPVACCVTRQRHAWSLRSWTVAFSLPFAMRLSKRRAARATPLRDSCRSTS